MLKYIITFMVASINCLDNSILNFQKYSNTFQEIERTNFFDFLKNCNYLDYLQFIDSNLNEKIDVFIKDHFDVFVRMKINKNVFVAQLFICNFIAGKDIYISYH